MKKLLAIAMVAGMLSGLYGASLGLGARYDNIAGPEGTDPFFGIRADMLVKPWPVIGLRMGLVQIDFPEDASLYFIGTGVGADILVFIPLQAMLKPYLVTGIWYKSLQESYSDIILKAGLGAEVPFGPLSGYLEGTFNLDALTPEGMDGTTDTWFDVQGGIRIPLKF